MATAIESYVEGDDYATPRTPSHEDPDLRFSEEREYCPVHWNSTEIASPATVIETGVTVQHHAIDCSHLDL